MAAGTAFCTGATLIVRSMSARQAGEQDAPVAHPLPPSRALAIARDANRGFLVLAMRNMRQRSTSRLRGMSSSSTTPATIGTPEVRVSQLAAAMSSIAMQFEARIPKCVECEATRIGLLSMAARARAKPVMEPLRY
jgi:hypothetical protein